jgi:conjugal transfer pilus assembly protein TrbC
MLYPLMMVLFSSFCFTSCYANDADVMQETKKEYQNLAKDIADKSASNEEYKQFARDIASRVKNNQESKNYTPIPSNAIHDNNIIDEILADAPKVINSPSCSMKNKEGLNILVSFSMPEATLLKLDQQARKIGARLLIKGLINNSFKDTLSQIKKLNEQGMVIDLDPRIFAQFKVNHVPCFILQGKNNYDKLVGNVSLSYALKLFAGHGELKQEAQKYLDRLEQGS